jgi:hypothetical protein
MESTQTVTKVSLQTSQQVVGAEGFKSPLIVSSNNQHSKHDLSRTRLRALENSLENGQLWVPPSPSHRKTWEEQVRSTGYECMFYIKGAQCPITDNPQNNFI